MGLRPVSEADISCTQAKVTDGWKLKEKLLVGRVKETARLGADFKTKNKAAGTQQWGGSSIQLNPGAPNNSEIFQGLGQTYALNIGNLPLLPNSVGEGGMTMEYLSTTLTRTLYRGQLGAMAPMDIRLKAFSSSVF